MTLRLHAARAIRLSARLTPPALFVLMQTESIPKGGRSRVFGKRWLRTPSTLGPLQAHGVPLDVALGELSGHGLLRAVGRASLVCTTEGDLVKHCYNDLLAECEVNAVLRALAPDKIARAAALKRAMILYEEGRSWEHIRRALYSGD